MAAVFAVFEVRGPSMKRTDLLDSSFDVALKKMMKITQTRYRQVTLGWKAKDKPTFKIRSVVKNRSMEIFTTSTPFVFVAGGTRIRYAHMSHDFQPRTSYRSLKSAARKGSLLYVGAPARPGIEARDFTEAIIERIEKKMSRYLEEQLLKNAAKITKARFKKVKKINIL